MTRFAYTLSVLVGASLGVAACTDSIEDSSNTPPAGTTTGSDGNTFDHNNDEISVWDLIDRLAKEGPPKFTSRVHSCPKIRYATLGNVLTSLGVDLTNTTTASAGALYKSAVTAYAAPSYANRIREGIAITTSGASVEFDIFAAAADEVIAKLPTRPRCAVGGVPGPALFDAANTCNIDAISCLIGTPAQPGHVDLCNKSITSASDANMPNPTIGKRLAVAALLAAAYTCE